MNFLITGDKEKLSKLYLISYLFLMFGSLFGVYSEFNSNNVYPLPMYIKMIWVIALGIFFLIQMYVSIGNIIFIESRLRYIFFALFLLSALTLINLPIIKLRTLVLIILILNSNVLQWDKFVRIDLVSRLSGLFILAVMYIFNLFPQKYANANNFTRPDGTLRSAWGFNHPNALGSYYLGIIITLIILINSKFIIKKLSTKFKLISTAFIFLTGAYVEFYVTDSRSAQVALLIIFIGWTIKLFKEISSPKPIWGVVLMIVLNDISLVMGYKILLSTDLFLKINQLFSNRLVLQNQALMQYKINFFGNNMFKVGQPYWVDNEYIYNFIALGIFGALLFSYIFWKALVNTYKGNDFMLYVILISILCKAMFESTTFEYCSLFPIVFAFKYGNGIDFSSNWMKKLKWGKS
ncbi:hypothetical protein LNP10_05185 [Apilactobacillus nanyangensis]|uniref:Polysaccharide polymerase n=1 Tax=Apilactobacillus nanyangensis TaxID=2799579 RepID=A0ABT0HZU4_9LACO|nr:hypothetical protein [Apilactobacillus nanyangensis]MCK8611892.1 hypothetical protein [Apilactobacillus nanyangensis]